MLEREFLWATSEASKLANGRTPAYVLFDTLLISSVSFNLAKQHIYPTSLGGEEVQRTQLYIESRSLSLSPPFFSSFLCCSTTCAAGQHSANNSPAYNVCDIVCEANCLFQRILNNFSYSILYDAVWRLSLLLRFPATLLVLPSKFHHIFLSSIFQNVQNMLTDLLPSPLSLNQQCILWVNGLRILRSK